MIINKVNLKNFRSYEEETEFCFTPTGHKNIVLIGGENGAGKSTLFEAIKLCIYGPVTYGYQGFTSHYIAKIKSNINHNAYKEPVVSSHVSVTILLAEGTDQNIYTLLRQWTFEDKKLVENFTVTKNNKPLIGEKKKFFENYLTSLIPPNLFDFFFFDGENLSDSFIGKSASMHLKESILKLSNYDTLDILKRHLLQYQRNTALSTNEIANLENEYYLATEDLKNKESTLESLIASLESERQKLEDLNIKKSNLEEEFRSSGGLLESEKAALISNQNALEREREEINQYIRDFCNDILPLLLCSNILEQIKKQILDENSLITYENFKNKLDESALRSSLIEANILTDSTVDLSMLPNLILNKLFDIQSLANVKFIHQLSSDDKKNVLTNIDYILNNKETLNSVIAEKYTRLEEIAKELKYIREKINSSVNEDILENYLDINLKLNQEIAQTNSEIESIERKIEILNEEIISSNNKLKKAKSAYLQSMQSSKTLELTNTLVDTLDEIIFELTKDKIREIENNFISIFKELIRKDNYIDSIEIQNNFETTLYINKEYSSIEVYNLLKNLGIDEVEKKYGSKFIEDLNNYYSTSTKKELLKKVETHLKFESLILRTKFNINDFSKGEKQIYILSLVWALIKSSGVEIPFVIDTPYARIDETHRDSLTTKYLPNVSKQVIILSTNEEIDQKSYNIMKDYICNEYLLEFLDKERKTKVHNGYFFEV